MLEQRAVGVERRAGPTCLRVTGTISTARPVVDRVQAGDLLHVEIGDASELLVAEAHGGVDVLLGRPLGGDHEGELAGRVPVQRPLPLQHAGQVTEERHAAERVLAWTGIIGFTRAW